MKDVSYDNNGVPILSRSAIEVRTENLLRMLEPSCLDAPRYTPLEKIAGYLKQNYELKLFFEADLGVNNGRKIRGSYHIPSKAIYIDKSLKIGEPRFNFTLAHEIGHFVMHRNIRPTVLGDRGGSTIEDNDRDLVLDQLQTNNPRTWIEWQANSFASSLLLPRATVLSAVMKRQCELGISRNIGKVYLDRQAANYKNFKSIIDYLVEVYIVSKAAIRIRLRELNILEESSVVETVSSYGPEHISRPLSRFLDAFLSRINEGRDDG